MAADQSKTYLKIGTIIVGVFGSLIGILIYLSFGYLEYYQLGFKQQKSTSKVFTDEFYTGGRHFIGPDFTFRTYPASAQPVELRQVTVFSSDRLEVYVDIKFHYFIRPQQLRFLHRKYQLTYNTVIKSSAIDALKAVSPAYTTEQFIKNRTLVERAMENAVRQRIGGKCCESNCTIYKCVENCIPIDSCPEDKMGLMVNMRHFFLTKVSMPEKVSSRYLRALLLVEESQMEKYRLEVAVVNKEVYEAVKVIDNQAREVAENATAEARLIQKRAGADAVKSLGSARSVGLNQLLTECGISDEKKKMSLHYLDTLSDNNKVHLAVDFNNYVIGGGK